jgi:hypothetical protein
MTNSSELKNEPIGSEKLNQGVIHMSGQYIMSLTKILVPILTIILLIWTTYKAHNNFYVDAVQIPESIAKNGFTPEEASQQLVEQMVLLRRAEYNDKLLAKNLDIEPNAGISGGNDIQIPGTSIYLVPFGRFVNKFTGLGGRNVKAVIIGSGDEMELSLHMDLYGKQTVLVLLQDKNPQSIDNNIGSNVDEAPQEKKNMDENEVARAKQLIEKAALAAISVDHCMDIEYLSHLTTRALVKGNQPAIIKDVLQTCLAHWDPKRDVEAVLRLLVLLNLFANVQGDGEEVNAFFKQIQHEFSVILKIRSDIKYFIYMEWGQALQNYGNGSRYKYVNFLQDRKNRDSKILDHAKNYFEEAIDNSFEQAIEKFKEASQLNNEAIEPHLAMAIARKDNYLAQNEIALTQKEYGYNVTSWRNIVTKEDVVNEFKIAVQLNEKAEYLDSYFNHLDGRYYDAIIPVPVTSWEKPIADVYYNYGNFLADAGDCTPAAIQLRKSLALKPGDADTLSNIGRIFGNLKDIVIDGVPDPSPYFQMAISFDPKHVYAYANWANYLERANDRQNNMTDQRRHDVLTQISELYHEAIKRNPEYEDGIFNYIRFLTALGRKEEAENQLQFFIKNTQQKDQEQGLRKENEQPVIKQYHERCSCKNKYENLLAPSCRYENMDKHLREIVKLVKKNKENKIDKDSYSRVQAWMKENDFLPLQAPSTEIPRTEEDDVISKP